MTLYIIYLYRMYYVAHCPVTHGRHTTAKYILGYTLRALLNFLNILYLELTEFQVDLNKAVRQLQSWLLYPGR